MDPDETNGSKYTYRDAQGEEMMPTEEEAPQGIITGAPAGGVGGVAIGQAIEGDDPPARDDESPPETDGDLDPRR